MQFSCVGKLTFLHSLDFIKWVYGFRALPTPELQQFPQIGDDMFGKSNRRFWLL